jgi:transcriptional regulator NrdR family protein
MNKALTPKLGTQPYGLVCRGCGSQNLRVVYTRRNRSGAVVRRRECRCCGMRLTTWEKAIGERGP